MRLLSQWMGDLRIRRRGKLKERGRDGCPAWIGIGGDDLVSFRQDQVGAAHVQLPVENDGELLDGPLQVAPFGDQRNPVSPALARGVHIVERLHFCKIEPGGKRGHGIVERGPLAKCVFLDLLEVRIIDPEEVSIADGNARVWTGNFAPEFIWALERDATAAAHRLLKQVRGAVLGEVRLH